MKNYVYITFCENWENQWFILLDENNEPFTDFELAKEYARNLFNPPENFRYFGLSDFEQMNRNNAMFNNM